MRELRPVEIRPQPSQFRGDAMSLRSLPAARSGVPYLNTRSPAARSGVPRRWRFPRHLTVSAAPQSDTLARSPAARSGVPRRWRFPRHADGDAPRRDPKRLLARLRLARVCRVSHRLARPVLALRSARVGDRRDRSGTPARSPAARSGVPYLNTRSPAARSGVPRRWRFPRHATDCRDAIQRCRVCLAFGSLRGPASHRAVTGPRYGGVRTPRLRFPGGEVCFGGLPLLEARTCSAGT